MSDNRLDWNDIKLRSLRCAELRSCVSLAESGQLSKEDALIRAAYRLSIFKEEITNKMIRAAESNDVSKLFVEIR